ncbi:MAG: outer membrane protein assembly factor BamA [Alcanivorax sp.]|jgi:outer membrane protein insertion porin family|nr:MAG: outer membrane protein assembly factor BamA [Oceanobacter sp.]
MRFLLLAFWLGLFSVSLHAAPFTVTDIRLDGLQRVSAGTVFEAFPITAGDSVDDERLAEATRRLFSEGLFEDISLYRDGGILILRLVELPTITAIAIEGNKAIQTEALMDGLKQSGLAEGYVLKRATLERISLELERQYVAQGRYDASIVTEVVPLPRNRVELKIDVDEGNIATIEHINIVGNEVFPDEELLGALALQSTNFWSWYSSDNKYSREKLGGDLETLRSYYLDRGYIRFNIESTQVSVSPDKKGVYITVNVSEGEVYSIRDVKLAGELIVDESELTRLYLVKDGDVFSRRRVTYTSDLMTKRLGNEGYTFAKVNGIPKIDDDERLVDMTFFVEPGKRTYVRSIQFAGNDGTRDEILRREMIQMEGGWASTDKIESGKNRLNQLGYFKAVNVETPPVPGTDDMIDVKYTVEEQLSGSLNFNVGYAAGSGMILGASISQNNFMGSGNQMSLGVQKTDTVQSYNFSYLNPYYTIDGVSRGFNVFYRETDFENLSTVSDYQTNTYGGDVTFGYPISRQQRLSFAIGYANTEMFTGVSVPAEILDFVDKEGNLFNEYTLGLTWRYSSLNRGLFPTAGMEHKVKADISVPGSDLTYYKTSYTSNYYFPITNNDWVVRLRTDLGYGDGFGDLERLPFFKNFRAGGIGSVRGYQINSLGPKGLPEYSVVDVAQVDAAGDVVYETDNLGRPVTDTSAPQVIYVRDVDGGATAITNPSGFVPAYETDSSGAVVTAPFFRESERALGGNMLVEGSLELIFPTPFIEDRRSVRSVVFLDAGNTFTDECYVPSDQDLPTFTSHPYCENGLSADKIRLSTGVGLTWVTAIGPLTFTYSIPLNEKEGDRTEGFEFTLGQVF